MYRLKNDDISKIFTELIKNSKNNYPTKFAKSAIPQNHSL